MSKKIIIIAGPNGAGKTTFARAFLPEEAQCPRFINADLIAAGLSPFAPEAEAFKAGRLMLHEIAECVTRGESFAFETTMGRKVMTPRELHHAKDKDKDKDISASLQATQRAAALARQQAIQTDTAIVVVKDQKIVRLTADEIRNETLA